MRTRLGLAIVALAVAWLLPVNASAHEQAIAFTDLSIISSENDLDCANGTCRLEVAHRLAIHDAESTLMSVIGARADLYGDREAQAKFEAYVDQRFALTNSETGSPIELTLLGGEVERGYYWVYLEGTLPADAASIDVTQAVLMDAIPRQTNRVNVRHNQMTRTLVFNGGARPQTYRIR